VENSPYPLAILVGFFPLGFGPFFVQISGRSALSWGFPLKGVSFPKGDYPGKNFAGLSFGFLLGFKRWGLKRPFWEGLTLRK